VGKKHVFGLSLSVYFKLLVNGTYLKKTPQAFIVGVLVIMLRRPLERLGMLAAEQRHEQKQLESVFQCFVCSLLERHRSLRTFFWPNVHFLKVHSLIHWHRSMMPDDIRWYMTIEGTYFWWCLMISGVWSWCLMIPDGFITFNEIACTISDIVWWHLVKFDYVTSAGVW